MNNEISKEITNQLSEALNSKYGPFYASLFTLGILSLGYIIVSNNYEISIGEIQLKPERQDNNLIN